MSEASEKKFDFPMIPCIDVVNMPREVLDYCVDEEIQTHSQNDVACLEDDGNVFSEWLKSEGYVFSDCSWGDYFAILAS